MSERDAPIEIAGDVKGETEKAYLFYDGSITVWLPKSQVEWKPAENIMLVKVWLAYERGLI